jgi:DNA-binding NarL/FixJ family response regulator
VRNLLAGRRDPKLILVAPAVGECPRPRWLAAVRHAVVARDGGFPALLAAVERLCGDRLPSRSAVDEPAQRHVPLTDREAEVLTLLGDGLTTKEIARRLDRSPLTIQTHRKRIVAKIGRLGSTTAARTVALRQSHFVSD